MKKLTLLIICVVGGCSAAHAQTIYDYISEARGDTLVVKTYAEMEFEGNALPDLVAIDTDAPQTRVYELKQGGFYPVNYQINIAGFQQTVDRPLVIEGEDDTPHVSSTSDVSPPIIYGADIDGIDLNGGFIAWNTDVTLKNVISGAHSEFGSNGWSYADANVSGVTFTMDNVYMEHTYWIFVQSNGYPGNSLHVKDSYFVNMNGNGCRRNGGVYDNVSNPTHEIWVENSTHVMGAGRTYNFRNFPVNKAVFNHNTFVNISNAPIASMGYQTNMIVTNNLFVNTNVQAYYPGLDSLEADQDRLPMGIINIDSLTSTNGVTLDVSHLPEEFQNADPSEWAGLRKILVDGNAYYWSPDFDDAFIEEIETMHATYLENLPDGPVDGELMQASFLMNVRTQYMFDNNEEWPYLKEGTWYEGDPEFTEDFGLLDNSEGTPFADFLEFTKNSLNDENAFPLPSMRAEGNTAEETQNFAFPDWPIPVDLSYSNIVHLTGGLNGFPVGDLNWFPARKAQWDAQRDVEYAQLEAILNQGDPITGNPTGNIDSLALVHLYHNSNGYQWTNNENWLQGSIEDWYGVEVTDGIITGLNLTNNHLVGELPGTFSELTNLTELILSGNPELTGVLPENFTELDSLNVVYIDDTDIAIPVLENTKTWLENLDDFRSSGKADLPPVDIFSPSNNGAAQAVPVMLIWKGLPDVVRYHIELYKDNALSELVERIELDSDSWISVENLEYNNIYYWRINSEVSYGIGNWSEVYSFKTQLDAEEGPDLLSPEMYEGMVSIPVSFDWEEVTGAQSYLLEISKAPSFDTTTTIKDLTETEFIFEEAKDQTDYFWRVRAVAGNTPGGWSAIGTFVTELRAPETPTWGPEDGAEDVPVETTLAWNAAERAESYNIQLADNNDFENPIINETNIDSTQFNVSLEASTTYYWRIQAVNSSGMSEWSEVASFSTEGTTSMEGEQEIPEEFALQQNYPNPFNPSTVISYQLADNSRVELEVFDMLGRKIATLVNERKSAGSYTSTFDASRFSSGVYIYHLRAGDFHQTKKMLLIK